MGRFFCKNIFQKQLQQIDLTGNNLKNGIQLGLALISKFRDDSYVCVELIPKVRYDVHRCLALISILKNEIHSNMKQGKNNAINCLRVKCSLELTIGVSINKSSGYFLNYCQLFFLGILWSVYG
jgi:hypothetical protein